MPLFFTAMYRPLGKTGTIIPILKSGNPNKYDLSSDRPITLSRLFGKVFDVVFYNRYFANLLYF